MGELLTKAICFAAKAHENQIRKMANVPYILHPLEDASIVSTITDDEDVMIAAILHDTVEDTDTKIEDIITIFGEKIAKLVSSETENKRPDQPACDTWKIRKEENLKDLRDSEDMNVKILWLGDKLSNMRSLYRKYSEIGDKAFDYFNQKDKKEQEWYYRTIAEYLEPLKNTVAYEEYVSLLDKIFND